MLISSLARQELSLQPQTTESQRFEKYVDDPVGFARDILGVVLWNRQIEILEALVKEDSISVRSGQKIGKGKCAICAALWFACTRPAGRVVLTAPTHRQIKSILWRELKIVYHQALARTPGGVGGTLNEGPENGLKWEGGAEIVGFATTEPEKMAGISGAYVLFIADEASGIPLNIFDAIEGNRAGGAKMMMFSNPTQTSGYFFDAFNKNAKFWRRFSISSEEAAETGIPGLATKKYIDQRRREWGVGSVLWNVRIAGIFPSGQSDAVIPLVLVEAAIDRYEDLLDETALHFGVDPARFGDDRSCLFPRRGLKAFPPIMVAGQDTQQVGARVLVELRRMRFSVGERVRVKVDVVGMGAGVADYLREYHKKGEIFLMEIHASGKPKDEKKYMNIRAEMWFGLKEWLAAGGALPDDGELQAELTTPTYGFELKTQKLRIEDKKDVKVRLGRSPDKADGLCLAVYERRCASFHAGEVKSRSAE